MRTISEQRCFGGTVGFYAAASTALGLETRFAVFTPPQAAGGKVPVLTYLAGLTCTEETFMIKAGGQRGAPEAGILLVAPRPHPRAAWLDYDATALVTRTPFPGEILIDQGLADKFLAQELRPELFEEGSRKAGQKLRLRRHQGYDHSYYFIASFVDDHLRHHARELLR